MRLPIPSCRFDVRSIVEQSGRAPPDRFTDADAEAPGICEKELSIVCDPKNRLDYSLITSNILRYRQSLCRILKGIDHGSYQLH
jgi:hypothetical protein